MTLPLISHLRRIMPSPLCRLWPSLSSLLIELLADSLVPRLVAVTLAA